MKKIPPFAFVVGLSLLLGACAAPAPEGTVESLGDPETPQLTAELDPVGGPAPGAVDSQPVVKATGHSGVVR